MSAAVKRRGLHVLLVSTFFAWGGFFMVIPMISVHYVDGLGWTAGAVGLVLAALVALSRFRVNSLWLVVGGALAGILRFLVF